MAEYLIQDTTLDAIADAINAKTGGSSAMTPAEMAAAIDAIPSGGGGSLKIIEETGSFTLAADTSGYKISHSLGVVPDEAEFWVEDPTNAPSPASGTYVMGGYYMTPKRGLHDTPYQTLGAQTIPVSAVGIYRRTDGVDKQERASLSSQWYIRNCTSSIIEIGTSSRLIGNCTYKWRARAIVSAT